jgi:hypothetical protein
VCVNLSTFPACGGCASLPSPSVSEAAAMPKFRWPPGSTTVNTEVQLTLSSYVPDIFLYFVYE